MNKGTEQSLPNGYKVATYEIRSLLGVGGFGITYKGWDATLERWVAVKEFLPSDLAMRDPDGETVRARADKVQDYAYALDRFLQEARTLARFNHPNIVRVTDFVEANQTAYLIMDYVEGLPLSGHLRSSRGRLSEEQLKDWFIPLLRGLREVHAAGFLHRDIKPGNIYIRDQGDPVLLDFGAARQAIGEHTRSVTGIFTAGYAPVEQYATDSKMQGPWTDLYSIGATLYRCVTRITPVDAPTRQSTLMDGEPDPMLPATDLGRGGYSEAFLQLIDDLLIIQARRRPQSIDEVLDRLEEQSALLGAAPEPAPESVDVMEQADMETELAEDAPTAATVLGEDALAELETEVIDAPTEPLAFIPEGSGDFARTVRKPRKRKKKSGPGLLLVGIALAVAAGGGYWYYLQQDDAAVPGLVAGFAGQDEAVPAAPADLTPVVPAGGEDAMPAPAAVAAAAPATAAVEEMDKPVTTVPVVEPEAVKKPMAVLTRAALLSGSVAFQVDSDPAGATVALNGIDIGTTPFSFNGVLAGRYELTLQREGNKVYKSAIKLEEGQPFALDTRLDVATGSLSVATEPPGARIELDGKPLADRTPVTLNDLPVGSHRLRLSVDQHQPLLRTVDVRADELTREVGRLQPIPHGKLTLQLTPATAAVTFIDLELPYRAGMELPYGEYAVRVEAPGHHAYTGKIEVQKSAVNTAVVLREALPAGQVVRDTLAAGGDGPDMVVLPTGSFRMGCVSNRDCESDERPLRTVTLDNPIAMSKYEVTFAEYDRYAGAAGVEPPPDLGWGRDRRPVINVNHNDAKAYARWLSDQTSERYRLPTEAEWEYAARAGTQTRFAFGDDEDGLCRYANVADLAAQQVQTSWAVANCDDGHYRTAPVGSYQPNAFGLYDMHGNVWEWVEDCYTNTYRGAPRDGSARRNCGTGVNVIRGGSWSDRPAYQRIADRDKVAPGKGDRYFGFRLVREL